MVLDEEDKSEIRFINNKFFLSSFRMSFQEKAQVTETFGSANISFFNDKAKIYNLSGQAIDYPSNGDKPHSSMNQSSLTQMYNNHLRGTQLVKSKSIMLLKVFNHMVYGYPLNFNVNYSSNQDKLSNFSFQMVVTKHSQNLPGLFETKDLEDSYSVKNVILNEEDSYRLSLIEEFENALKENLYLPEDIFPPRGVNILSILYAGDNLVDLSYRIRSTADWDETKARNLKSHIRKGLNGFLNFINTTDDSRFSTALGIRNFSAEGSNPNSLAVNLANGAIDNMFNDSKSWDKVKEFLAEIQRLRTKLSIIKTSIQLRQGNE